MNYQQIIIQANEPQQEELISRLDDWNAAGFEQQPGQLIAYFAENDFDEQEIQSVLSGFDYTVHIVKEQNWNQVWESNFQPVVVADFCAIRADFHPTITSVQHQIIITPKMSFGTGH